MPCNRLYAKLPPDHVLKRALIFDANPQVQRILFICVPHRGSDLAINWIGSLGRGDTPNCSEQNPTMLWSASGMGKAAFMGEEAAITLEVAQALQPIDLAFGLDLRDADPANTQSYSLPAFSPLPTPVA